MAVGKRVRWEEIRGMVEVGRLASVEIAVGAVDEDLAGVLREKNIGIVWEVHSPGMVEQRFPTAMPQPREEPILILGPFPVVVVEIPITAVVLQCALRLLHLDVFVVVMIFNHEREIIIIFG